MSSVIYNQMELLFVTVSRNLFCEIMVALGGLLLIYVFLATPWQKENE